MYLQLREDGIGDLLALLACPGCGGECTHAAPAARMLWTPRIGVLLRGLKRAPRAPKDFPKEVGPVRVRRAAKSSYSYTSRPKN